MKNLSLCLGSILLVVACGTSEVEDPIETARGGGLSPPGSGQDEPPSLDDLLGKHQGGASGSGVASGTGGAAMLCTPGASVACACMGGTQGAQTCAADGLSFGPCSCPASGLGGSSGTGGAAMLCTPGASVACACMGGTQGAQTCAADGMSFGPCTCLAGTGGSSGNTGAGGAQGTGGSTGSIGGAGGSSSGTGGTGGGNSSTGCQQRIASHELGVCVDPDGRLFFSLDEAGLPGGGTIPDAEASTWSVMIWLLADPQNGIALPFTLVAARIAVVQLPTLKSGWCAYASGAHRHPIRISAPYRGGVWALLGGYAGKQAGIWANLPDHSGGNWGPTIAVARHPEGYLPAATYAAADMLGPQLDCSP